MVLVWLLVLVWAPVGVWVLVVVVWALVVVWVLEVVWVLVPLSRRSSLVLTRRATADRQTEATRWDSGTRIEVVCSSSSNSGQRLMRGREMHPASGTSTMTLGKPPKPRALTEPSLRKHLPMAYHRAVISNLGWVVSRSATSMTTEVEIPAVTLHLGGWGCSLLKQRTRVARHSRIGRANTESSRTMGTEEE